MFVPTFLVPMFVPVPTFMNVGTGVFEKSEGQPNIFTHIQTNDLTRAACGSNKYTEHI